MGWSLEVKRGGIQYGVVPREFEVKEEGGIHLSVPQSLEEGVKVCVCGAWCVWCVWRVLRVLACI